MKKIKIISLFALLVTLVSCNMDKLPYNGIETGQAIQSVSDAKALRVGLYSGMKGRLSGLYVWGPDLQTDVYHAMNKFGNYSGAIYKWNILSSDYDVRALWEGYYLSINNANFLINGIDKLLEDPKFSEADKATLSLYRGEAHFVRAMMYYELAQRFCKAYNPTTAETDLLGLPIVTIYAPTSLSGSYPGRSSMAVTFKRITDDLDIAIESIKVAGSKESLYITEDVVKAFSARLALQMKNYPAAYTLATQLIEGGKYQLITDKAAFAKMWKDDVAPEAIWKIALSITDLGNNYQWFMYNIGTGLNPQYVPEKWVLDLYNKTADIRYPAYFTSNNIELPVPGTITLFTKFPGNPALYSGNVSNYQNMPKVFRIAEMYLIAAEASYYKGEEPIATLHLNDLKRARIAGWNNVDYTGQDLINEIRAERVREMVGEGQRMPDLKRWGIGVKRGAPQVESMILMENGWASVDKAADNYQFQWPIPQSEIDANPQIKLEQNLGY